MIHSLSSEARQVMATLSRDETDRSRGRRRVDALNDWVLDEPVVNLLCSRTQRLWRDVSVANRPVTTVAVARVEQTAVRSGDVALVRPGGAEKPRLKTRKVITTDGRH